MKGITRLFPWLDVYADTALRPGHEWEEAIMNMIASAHMFILLISPAFIASDFIMDKELPAMRARRHDVGALLLPVVLSKCSWQYVCGAVQAVPRNDKVLKPIDEWETPRKGFVQAHAEIVAEIVEHFGVPMQFFDWSAK